MLTKTLLRRELGDRAKKVTQSRIARMTMTMMMTINQNPSGNFSSLFACQKSHLIISKQKINNKPSHKIKTVSTKSVKISLISLFHCLDWLFRKRLLLISLMGFFHGGKSDENVKSYSDAFCFAFQGKEKQKKFSRNRQSGSFHAAIFDRKFLRREKIRERVFCSSLNWNATISCLNNFSRFFTFNRRVETHQRNYQKLLFKKVNPNNKKSYFSRLSEVWKLTFECMHEEWKI